MPFRLRPRRPRVAAGCSVRVGRRLVRSCVGGVHKEAVPPIMSNQVQIGRKSGGRRGEGAPNLRRGSDKLLGAARFLRRDPTAHVLFQDIQGHGPGKQDRVVKFAHIKTFPDLAPGALA
ncbi:MAG: hypothetical protein QOF80_2136 [Verrucomicrobiota bacterium]